MMREQMEAAVARKSRSGAQSAMGRQRKGQASLRFGIVAACRAALCGGHLCPVPDSRQFGAGLYRSATRGWRST